MKFKFRCGAFAGMLRAPQHHVQGLIRVWTKPLALIFAFLLFSFTAPADDRLWIEARINGQKARLIFDTGADRVVLFSKAAERLDLSVNNPPDVSVPDKGRVAIGFTSPCDLTLFQTTYRTSVAVLGMPPYLPMRADGVIGWGPLQDNVLCISGADLTATLVPDVPEGSKPWLSLPIRSNTGFLFLKTPAPDCSNAVVLVDTGFSGGVALAPSRWRKWKAAHGNQSFTLDSYFMPGAGLVVKEEMWASKLEFGPLVLTDIPVTEANAAQVALGGPGFQGSFGLAALKRLELVVDGPGKRAYVWPRKGATRAFQQNRLGAVFVPTQADADPLLAHVAPHSPAFEAGIRDGDVLLKIDQLDVTQWRTKPGILPLARFWEQPAGTRLRLTLERNGDLYCTTVFLREILMGDHSPA